MYEIVFYISTDASFNIPVVVQEHEQHLYSAGSIFLKRKGCPDIRVYCNRPLFSAIDELRNKLQRALSGELELPLAYKQKGFGYMYNEYIMDRLDGSHRTELGYWIGSQYELWGSGRDCTVACLYTMNGKIYVEVDFYYSWARNPKPKTEDGYVTYEEYMKTYKPIAVLELSRETAQEWLEQSRELLHIMNVNSENIESTSDE